MDDQVVHDTYLCDLNMKFDSEKHKFGFHDDSTIPLEVGHIC